MDGLAEGLRVLLNFLVGVIAVLAIAVVVLLAILIF